MRIWLDRVIVALMLVAVQAVSANGEPDGREAEYIRLRVLIGEQKFAEAGTLCRDLIARFPDYVYLYETLPEIALYAQEMDAAVKFFEQRIEDGTNLELSYFGLGTVYFNMSAYRQAALCFDRAIALGISAPECYRNFVYAYERMEGLDASIRFFSSLCHHDPQNPNLWYAVALAYWSKRDYPAVLKNISQALAQKPTEPKYSQAKAALLLLMGQTKEGSLLTSSLLTQARTFNDLSGLQFLSSYEVLRQDREKRPLLDNDLARQSLETAQRFGQFRWIGWWYERLANLEYSRSMYAEAVMHSQVAIDASQKSADNQLALDALIREVESSMDLGNYEWALKCAYKELEVSNGEKDNVRIARAFSDLAWIYHELGVDDIAMDYAIEALAISENIKATNEVLMRVYATLGLIYEAVGNHESALANFVASDNLIPEGGVWVPQRAVSHGNIGRVFLNSGNLKAAEEHFSEEQRLSKQASFSREEAYSLVNIGDCALRLKRNNKAKAAYLNAHQLSQRIAQKPTLLASALGLARLASKLHINSEAIAWYDSAFTVAESMGLIWEERLLGDLRRDFLEEDLRKYISLLVKQRRYIQAFNSLERYRFSNHFVGTIAYARFLQPNFELHESTRLAIDSIVNQVRHDWLCTKIPKPDEMANGSKYDLNLVATAVLKEIEMRRCLSDLVVRMRESSDCLRPKLAKLKDVSATIKSRYQRVVEYLLDEESSLAFIVGQDTLQVVELKIGRMEVEKLVERIASVFSGGKVAAHPWIATFANFDPKGCAEAYTKLLEPVLQTIPSVRELTIIPDGVLVGVPFECFMPKLGPGGSFAGGTFVVEKLAINYSLTATAMVMSSANSTAATRALLAVGNPNPNGQIPDLWKGDTLPPALLRPARDLPPLPGAEKEMHAIENEFGADATILANGNATKSMLKALISDYLIVHIAAHSSSHQAGSPTSAIYLSPDKTEQCSGILTASELSNIGLNARLVVLSSCNTVKFSGGVDEAGFVRNLLAAGVPSIVGCLWSADDNSTALLMSSFYHHLREGEGVACALQKAKLDLIRSGRMDPYYWASFVLVGDPSPVDMPPPRTAYGEGWRFAWLMVAFATASLVVFRKQRKAAGKPGAFISVSAK
jgi:CHAT domain-containing protein/tetratricopeptide (TPR) repeat protein